MFRQGTIPTNIQNINCFLENGGMGDHICWLVPIKYIENNCPWINLLIWVPDYLVDLAKNLLHPTKFTIRGHSQFSKKGNPKLQTITTRWERHTSMSTHPIAFGFHMLVDKDPLPSEMNYLRFKPELVKYDTPNHPYVVISVGSTAKVKELPSNVINEIASFCKSKGFTPVFIGKENNDTGSKFGQQSKIQQVDFSLGINLVNKTNMLQSAKVINNADAFISMDGGLTHLAGCSETPIVFSTTFVDPLLVTPIRESGNIYPIGQPESLECRYCQSRWHLLFDHSFLKCYYDDYQCVKNLTSDKFIEILEKIL